MAATSGALDAVATKTGLSLEIYAATVARFSEVNVFKEICTVQTISGGYSGRFDVRGGGDSSSIKQLALGGEPAKSGLNLNKRIFSFKDIFYLNYKVVYKRFKFRQC